LSEGSNVNERSDYNDPTSRSITFARLVAEQIGYYVYLLIDPRDGEIFYVGKGIGDRCFAHLDAAAKATAIDLAEYPKLDRIRAIHGDGDRVLIEVLRHGLDEATAFEVECAAIDLLRLERLTNLVSGHGADETGRMSVADINALYGATPVEIDDTHHVVLVRINRLFRRGIDDAALYEATRAWWKVGPQRRDLTSPKAPHYAFAVFRGVVRAVYRIDDWVDPSADTIAEDHRRAGRFAFVGQRAADLEAQYVGRDVSAYLRSVRGFSTQNPLRFVHCG
jgi:hypothetical protein